MAIFRSLKTLITKNSKTRPFVTTTTTVFLKPPLYTPLSHRLPCFAPFQGPLFLSFPPWKLSQSATPLNGVFLRKVQALNSELIRDGIKLPSKLRFGSDVLNRAKDEVGRQGLLNSFVNLPNLVSMSRLVSGPFIGWMIMNEMYSSAFLALAISGATDWLDGYMARRMKINSVVGSYLDPLADKVLIGCVALAMVHMDLLHPALVGIVVLRDVALVGGAFYIRASSLGWKWKSWSDFINLDGTSPQKIEPLFLSKVAAELTLIQSFVKSRVHMVNTVFQLVLIAAALLQPEFGTPETQSYITYLSLLTASTTVASTIAYGGQYMRKKSALIARKL